MANKLFWNDTSVEPKRAFRWLFYLQGPDTGLPTYVARVVKKPSFTVSNVQHQFVAHTFNFPGRIQWDPVEITLVDPIADDASTALTRILVASGYKIPANQQEAQYSFSRAKAVTAMGNPTIEMIDSDSNPIERWTLKNAWVERVDYGQLDYTSEEIVNITLGIRYDYAEYFSGTDAASPILAGSAQNG